MHYEIYTMQLKMVRDYTGLSFDQILDLPLSLFLLYRYDSYIYDIYTTTGGKEYLEQCWLMEQTKPDKENLRKLFGGGKIGG